MHEEASEFRGIVRSLEDQCSDKTNQFLQSAKLDRPTHYDCIWVACSYIDNMASCLWGCQGGNHGVQYLCGKISSQSKSSLYLLQHGYYDEALGLCRMIGETSNLLCLFYKDDSELKKWFEQNNYDHPIKKFKPASVRDRLEKHGIDPPMKKDRFQELSNQILHVNPHTRPQEYNDYSFSILGGVFQKEGWNQVVSELSKLLCFAVFFGVELLEIPDCPKKIILMHNTYMAQKNGIDLSNYTL